METILFSIYSRNSSNIYYLASTENTWACLDVSFTESIWKTFIDIVIEVLNESENLFTYDSREKIVAQINGEKFFWSKTLRKGMLTTLIIKSTYKKAMNHRLS